MGALSMVVLIYTLIAWLSGATVAGWTSLMVIVLLIGGVQMVAIGILGEYIGRLYMQGKERPLYVLDEIIRASGTPAKVNPLEKAGDG